MTRIILGVEYDGSAYAGWQWQNDMPSVQGKLQAALSVIANNAVTVICAGRTDTGVHALEQVVHFDTEKERDEHAWLMGGNSQLPGDIRILWVKQAGEGFHARYSAIARFYRYVIINRSMKSALRRQQTTWCYQPLDAEKMHQAAQYLVGEHDFSSFRAQSCQSKSPQRQMHFIDVYRQEELVIIDICANAFLHHMVRNIAGVLMTIGMGKQPVTWTESLLGIRDRAQGGITAPPDGLHLGGVLYPEEFGLSKHPVFAKLPEGVSRFKY